LKVKNKKAAYMKLHGKDFINLFSKKDKRIIQEALQNKSKSIHLENNAFQNDLLLLKQERIKKYNELALWFSNEYNKLLIKHNQKLNNIQIG
jgi:hypothetical protein